MASFLKKIKPWHHGLIIGLITFLVLVFGWSKCGETNSEFALLFLISIAVGFCVFILSRSRLKAWLVFSCSVWLWVWSQLSSCFGKHPLIDSVLLP